MRKIKDEVYPVDMIGVVSEQLIGFIMREILDPTGEFYHDCHIAICIDIVSVIVYTCIYCNRDINRHLYICKYHYV